jgi:hypothetical protein
VEDIHHIEERLRQVADAIAQAQAEHDRLRPERDRMVVEASRAGLSRRRVAELAGLTPGRVQQILDSQT